MAIADDIIARESGGDPNAQNSRSSAGGAGQFIDSTWLSMLQRHRPDIATGKSPSDLLQLKFDPQLSREMTAAYAADNGAILAKNGHQVTPGTTYLAHFAGPQGAVQLLNADPATPVRSILTPQAVAANPFLQNMTAAELRLWADGKRQKPTAPVSTAVQQPAPPPPESIAQSFTAMSPVALTVPSFEPQIAPQPVARSDSAYDEPAFAHRTYARQMQKQRAV